MSERFGNILSDYIRSRTGVFKKYLLAILMRGENCICYPESIEGTPVRSSDLKNCELLRDAQILSEDVRLSRHGRNSYKCFCLTELGRQFAEELKQESVIEEETENKLQPVH